MTRIAFAYNQKPDVTLLDAPQPLGASAEDDEPPNLSPIDDRYAEWDDAHTIDAVAAALAPLGEVIRLEADASFPERLRDAQPDIVFNIAEGLRGVNREAHVPAICEYFGLPYSGSDPFTLTLCLDKARAKESLAWHGVPTASFTTARSSADLDAIADGRHPAVAPPTANAPLFVKPLHEGSSKGITEANYISSPGELRAVGRRLLECYAQPVLVETFLPGAEFTCGILGNGGGARVLPLVGIAFDALPAGALPIYGFEAKWMWDRPERPLGIFECPARVTDAVRSAVAAVALRAYEVLGCRDWARIDVRLDHEGQPMVIEVNPLPGILPDPADNSCLPKAARAAGIEYDGLIQACLRAAAERVGVMLTNPVLSGVA